MKSAIALSDSPFCNHPRPRMKSAYILRVGLYGFVPEDRGVFLGHEVFLLHPAFAVTVVDAHPAVAVVFADFHRREAG